MRTLRWLSVLTLLALVLNACGAQEVTAEQIMQRFRTARANTQNAHATFEVVLSGGREDSRFVIENWLAKSDKLDPTGQPLAKSRMKVLESSRSEMVNSEIINDGTTVWVYNPTEQQAIRGDISELTTGAVGAQDPTAQLQRIQDLIQQVLDGSNVEILAENEPIAGRDAWKLKLTPKPETAAQLQFSNAIEATMWIDKARDIPLKGVINAAEIGKIEGTVISVELDQGVDATIFSFTPPAGTTIVDAAELARDARPQTTTLEDAGKAASFKVLTPQPLPAGVTLQEVQTSDRGGENVIQNYTGTVAFSLVQSKGQGRGFGQNDTPFGAKTETVTVRGQEATLITGTADQKGTLLRWQENGVSIIIAGTLTGDEAQAIAASLK